MRLSRPLPLLLRMLPACGESWKRRGSRHRLHLPQRMQHEEQSSKRRGAREQKRSQRHEQKPLLRSKQRKMTRPRSFQLRHPALATCKRNSAPILQRCGRSWLPLRPVRRLLLRQPLQSWRGQRQLQLTKLPGSKQLTRLRSQLSKRHCKRTP